MNKQDFTDNTGRIHSLDGLRAFSILIVCLGHLKGTVGAPDLLHYFHSPGSRFFFIISSFLITWMLLSELDKNGRVNLGKFFKDRIFRIFPAFYVYILVGALLAWWGLVDTRPGDLFHASTFTMNFHDDRAWHFNHTWSLGFQEQFYLVWPFILLLVGRKNLPLFLGLTLLAIPVVRAIMWYAFEASPTAMMRNFQAVVDTLAIGCLFAFACHSGRIPKISNIALRALLWAFTAALFLAALGLYYIDTGLFYIFGQSLANIATTLALYLCLSTKTGFVHFCLNNPVSIYVGTISYSIYLWHTPFLNSYETGLLQSYPLNIVLSVIAALTSYYLVEKPFIRLKKIPLKLPTKSMAIKLSGFLLLLSGVLLTVPSKTQALDIIFPRASVSMELSNDPASETMYLHVQGTNKSSTIQTLVVQVDDKAHQPYNNRVNMERQIPLGPFEFELSLGGLKTNGGRTVSAEQIRKIIVFCATKANQVELSPLRLIDPMPLPSNVKGWDFGPKHAAIFPGFEKVQPNHQGLMGEKLTPLSRPSGDPLGQDGIRGIQKFETPLPNGLWQILLWTEDLGAWQSLPYWTKRRIKINGKTISNQTRSPIEWVNEVYRRGARNEAYLDGSSWDLLGDQRGGLLTAITEVQNGLLTIELEGDLPPATFLAGIMATSINNTDEVRKILSKKRDFFLHKWIEKPIFHFKQDREIGAYSYREKVELRNLRLFLANNDRTYRDIWVTTNQQNEKLSVEFVPLEKWPSSVNVNLRIGLWQFQRTEPSNVTLMATSDRLVPLENPVRSAGKMGRRISLDFRSTEDVPAGTYSAALILETASSQKIIDIELTILEFKLPAIDKSVGVYLEEQTFLSWFGAFSDLRETFVLCDLANLRNFGLTTIAPPFSLRSRDRVSRYASIVNHSINSGFNDKVLSYTGFKWAKRDESLLAAISQIDMVNNQFIRHGRDPVLWSIADEPRNKGKSYADLIDLITTFRKVAPAANLAAHLNHRSDRKIAKLLDVALINPGYGIDETSIRSLKQHGVSPWLYNMEHPRLAAGFYLWRSDVDGYMQWHARMPTADPFDPTDGRETDFQLLFPSLDACAAQEIHSDLLLISQGIQDFKWLRWLERQAKLFPESYALMMSIKEIMPDDWDSARTINDADLTKWVVRIKKLANDQSTSGS